jgi:hypothetical protein
MFDHYCPFCDHFLAGVPDFETPEQYKERTGEPWPDNAAVYWKWADDDAWTIGKYSVMRDEYDPFGVWIICATEAGPPPEGWRPEEGVKVAQETF